MPVNTPYLVIGHPLGHSMSPFIHTRLFSLLDMDASYGMQDIAPDVLDTELPALLGQVNGLNVTIPHKQAVIPHLTRLEGRAAIYRSVNTIAVTPDSPVGYNTDADGFLKALSTAGVPLQGRVALLGCGGVARTFACEAALAGCTIVNGVREADKAAAAELQAFVTELVPGVEYTVTLLDELDGSFDLLINATPVGMYPHVEASPVTADVLANTKAVFDAVYNPRDTKLLQMAKEAGAVAIGGMAMLVWQAAVAQEIWLQREHDPVAVNGVVQEALDEMERMFHG